MKNTYLLHKRIIEDVKQNKYPWQIIGEKCEEFKSINHLIDNGWLSGVQDKYGLAVTNLSTNDNTEKYIEIINIELINRNPIIKLINKIPPVAKFVGWVITTLIAIAAVLITYFKPC